MAHTPKNQSEKAILTARRAWCYLVLVLISFLCLFFFYVLVINSTRTHFEIQKGFSLLPGGAELAITIHEGRNRQVRKMCAAVGLRVTKLRRVREGSVELGDLPAGKWRSLTAEEIASFDR